MDYNLHLNNLMRNAKMYSSSPNIYAAGYQDWMLHIQLPVDAKAFKKLGMSMINPDLSNYLYRAFGFTPYISSWISDREPRAKKGIRTLHFEMHFKGNSQFSPELGLHGAIAFKALKPESKPHLELINGGAA